MEWAKISNQINRGLLEHLYCKQNYHGNSSTQLQFIFATLLMNFTIKNLFYHHSHIGDTLECAFENALHLLPDRNCIKEHLAKFTNFCTTCGNVWNSSKNTKQNSKKQMFQSEKLLFSVLRHLALFHEYHLKRFQIYSLCTRFHKYKKL